MKRFHILLVAAVGMTGSASADTVVAPTSAPAIPEAPAAAAVAPATPPKAITVTSNKDVKTPWSGEKIVCTRETPVGSLIPVRRCTTKSNDSQNERNARDMLARPIPMVTN